jgi:hypothetical protein
VEQDLHHQLQQKEQQDQIQYFQLLQAQVEEEVEQEIHQVDQI